MLLLSLASAVALALTHLLAGRLRFLDAIPRSRWLSAAGGVSVAYVFVHLLPELQEAQRLLEEGQGPLARLEELVYLVALAGLVVFYGLEGAARRDRAERSEGEEGTSSGVFWLHMASYSVYNAMVGHLLLERQEAGALRLLVFSLAMLLHFVVNDFGLREHHREQYARTGRWLLAAAVLGGWLLAVAVELREEAVLLLLAFIGGGVVLNVLKEELPEERRSRYSAFLLGASAYAGLLLLA